MLRRQLPVYSPISLGAVLGGVRQLLAPSPEARDELRTMLQSRFGSRRVLLTDSGTHALTLALRAVKVGRPELPVALPAYCCYDIATAADGADVRVALYDVDPKTLGPDFASLGRVAAAGVSAIVVAHLYGIPVDMDAVWRVAREAGAEVIEDAAQGAGGSYRGKPLGAHGSLAILSFGRGKGITSGRGGALLGNDARGLELLTRAGIAEVPHSRGATEVVPLVAQWLLARPSAYGIPSSLPGLRLGETIYHRPTATGGLSRFGTGVLAKTLHLGEAEAAVRRKNAARILQIVSGHPSVSEAHPPVGGVPGYLRLPLLGLGRSLRTSRARAVGIMPGYPKSLADLNGFGERRVGAEQPVGARTLAAGAFTMPTHSWLREGDLREVDRLLATLDA